MGTHSSSSNLSKRTALSAHLQPLRREKGGSWHAQYKLLLFEDSSENGGIEVQLDPVVVDLDFQIEVDLLVLICSGLVPHICFLAHLVNCFSWFTLLAMASSQKKYQHNLHDALQVTNTTGQWTVIVQVLIKYPTKASRGNPNMLFKKFLLTDMKGTLISAITFSAIEHFDIIFEPFKRYYVTSAAVKVADSKYKIGEYNYTWMLYPRTHVQLIEDLVPHVSPYSFDFIKYSDMFRMANRDISVAVKGLIVHSIPVPHATKPFIRDYIVIDEEERPMILRVWEDALNESESGVTEKLPKPTFIAAVDLKVTTHNGLSLTTGFNANFMINPPLRETEPLLYWYNDHVERIGQLIQEEAYRSTDILLPPPSKADFVPIKHVLASMETLKSAWVSGTIHLLPTQTKLWHNVCDKCKKTVNLPVGSELPCTFCNQEMNVEPRCHVHVFLNDIFGTLSATLFATTAEKFIGYTARQLMEAAEQNTPLNDEIERKIEKKRVLCFLKDYDRSFESRFERTFPVVALYAEDKDSVVASSSAENEKQPFSPTTKTVIEEIATKINMNPQTLLPSTIAKRGIIFDQNSSETENVLISQKTSSPTNEAIVVAAGSESPVKKLKNVASGN